MCGIAGLMSPRLTGDRAALAARAGAMADAIAHRGPDGSGVWVDAVAGVALSHRRLAVIDVTPTGAQPMVSADGRWVISYNGEVYNAATIARTAELSGIAWRGTSDTEVILESVARRGLDATLADLNGMFAIALWDRAKHELHLIRDRLGIKPLFYATGPNGTHFASELKSLLAGGAPVGAIDPASVASFLRFGYVPAPHTIFRDVGKVMPGEVVSIDSSSRMTRRRYWSLAAVAQAGLSDPLDVSDNQAVEHLHDLLADAVAGQMISDVPLGAFLSGGIDSSTIVALMVAAGRGPVRTFSIGFPEAGYDESGHAAAVAKHLGTVHQQLVVTAADALALVPDVPEIYDEPFADSSQIPTILVSKLTRRHVTVALSGDGGDELFAGYNRYVWAETIGARVLRWPLPLRRAAAQLLRAVPDAPIDWAATLLPPRFAPPQLAEKLRKAAQVLPLDDQALYLRLVTQGTEPAEIATAAPEHPLAGLFSEAFANGSDALRSMQLIDTGTYLPDDILQKVDRASMTFALEVRPPLLDHRVVDLALRLPRRFRIRDGESKWLLRRVLDRYVPRHLIDRPKMGFGVPLADWLRGPLRDWAEDLLERRSFGGGLLDADAAHRMWREHLAGRRDSGYPLWTLLMFEAWRRRWSGIRAVSHAAPDTQAGMDAVSPLG
jgi:asparagine synthase (glutamine-hydrolysing)